MGCSIGWLGSMEILSQIFNVYTMAVYKSL